MEILESFEQEIQNKILNFASRPNVDARKNVSDALKSFLLTWDDYPLLKNLGKADFDYLVRKIPAERVMEHAKNDEEFTNQLIKKIKKEGITVKASPRVIGNLMKSLFFFSLHREDMGDAAYTETMNLLIDLVAGHIVGE